MDTPLSTIKQTYIVYVSWGQKHTVMLEQKPDWSSIIRNKEVVQLDWLVINWSYITCVEQNNEWDKQDSALARAKSQSTPFKEVACERVKTYENKQWHPMSLVDIKKWMDSFIKDWCRWWWDKELKKYYDLYISLWWSLKQIWS